MMWHAHVAWHQIGTRFLIGVTCLGLLGCSIPKVASESSRIGATGIGPQDRISVIGVEEFEVEPEPEPFQHLNDRPVPAPRKPTSTIVRWGSGSCLEGSIRTASDHVLTNFVSAKDFVEAMFPGQSAEDVGKILKSGDYPKQLSEPSTAARVASLNIRYLIVAHSRTSATQGRIDGGISRPYPLAFGMAETGTRSTSWEADVIDVAKGVKVGTASTRATGNRASGMAFFLILPIPFGQSSPTETVACWEIGKSLAELILDRSPEESRQAASELQRLRGQPGY